MVGMQKFLFYGLPARSIKPISRNYGGITISFGLSEKGNVLIIEIFFCAENEYRKRIAVDAGEYIDTMR